MHRIVFEKDPGISDFCGYHQVGSGMQPVCDMVSSIRVRDVPRCRYMVYSPHPVSGDPVETLNGKCRGDGCHYIIRKWMDDLARFQRLNPANYEWHAGINDLCEPDNSKIITECEQRLGPYRRARA